MKMFLKSALGFAAVMILAASTVVTSARLSGGGDNESQVERLVSASDLIICGHLSNKELLKESTPETNVTRLVLIATFAVDCVLKGELPTKSVRLAGGSTVVTGQVPTVDMTISDSRKQMREMIFLKKRDQAYEYCDQFFGGAAIAALDYEELRGTNALESVDRILRESMRHPLKDNGNSIRGLLGIPFVPATPPAQ